MLRPPPFPAPIIADRFRDKWIRAVLNYWGGLWTASLQLVTEHSTTREQKAQQETPEGGERFILFSVFLKAELEIGFCPEAKSLPYTIRHLSHYPSNGGVNLTYTCSLILT